MSEISNSESQQMLEIQELERQLAEKKAAANIESNMNQIERKAEATQENIPEAQAVSSTMLRTTPFAANANTQNNSQQYKYSAEAISMMDEKRKVETLVAIALERGIESSIETANALKDPYLLDALHDRLIGELHDRLVREKKLKDL